MSSGNNRTSVRRKSSEKTENGLGSFIKNVLLAGGKIDFIFLLIVGVLVIYGLMMLFSAGSARAYTMYGDVFYFVKRQAFWVVLGAAAMIGFANFDYHRLGKKLAGSMYVGCGVLLFLVIAGLGTTVNGATRWLFGFQPSEIAKIAIIIIFAYNISTTSGQKDLKSFKNGFMPYLVLLGIYIILLMLEPHFSCVLLISITAMAILFVGGVPLKHFGYIMVPALVGIVVLIAIEPYRMQRVLSFFDPFADAQGSGWQIVQSLYAIGSGGVFGVGLGQSKQKFQSLPEPQNDFIFSVVCEELGLIGAIILILLFAALLIRGIQIAMKAPDLFGTLLVVGIVGIVTLQALINIAVVTSSVPVTGMPLPFFSYGGTALCITMAEMGIVLNVSKQTRLPV